VAQNIASNHGDSNLISIKGSISSGNNNRASSNNNNSSCQTMISSNGISSSSASSSITSYDCADNSYGSSSIISVLGGSDNQPDSILCGGPNNDILVGGRGNDII
jgi:hypothetical protein